MIRPPRASDPHAPSLVAVRGYHILATSAEPAFDVFPALCCSALEVRAACLAFFDGVGLWVKAEAGAPRSGSNESAGYLRRAFESTRAVHASDARGFFCGAPVFTAERVAIGAIGAFDDRPRAITPAMLQAIRTVAEAVTHALEARKRLIHAAPVPPGKRTLYAVPRARRSTVAEHSIEAVLSKIEAGRRILRADANGITAAAAFVAATQQLLDDNAEPHVLVLFSAAAAAAAELVGQARRARLLCDHDLAASLDGRHVVMLLRDMPAAVGQQAVTRFAHAQRMTEYRISEVRGPRANARELIAGLIERLHHHA